MTNARIENDSVVMPAAGLKGKLRLHETVVSVLEELSHPDHNADNLPFFVCDLNVITARYAQWCELLPGVTPFYAIKACPDPQVLRTLFSLGASFDCASAGEIETVLAMGVDPDNIIYANPTKPIAHIRYAASRGVRMMTFDNADELEKVRQAHPRAQMVLRVLADDSKSVCQFGKKFGAHPTATRALLEHAKALGVEVIGVSFHVGSGCFDPQSFADAVRRAARVFEEGAEVGFNMRLLDLGGGFPGLDHVDGAPFSEIAAAIRPALAELPAGTRVIGEPGRYFAAPTFTLAVHVTSRRNILSVDDATGEQRKSFMYYVNDGVYGSFNCILFDHAKPQPAVLRRRGAFVFHAETAQLDEEPHHPCSLWGPTCDSMDLIVQETHLPELNVGDWLYFANMGAYTLTASSTFNGFPRPEVRYIPVRQ